jgi:hypothetical protein
MQLEEKLRLKKIKLTKLDEELKVQKEKFLKGVNDYKTERLNKEGLSENATLYITLFEAKDLKPMDYDGTSDPYVIFDLEDRKKTSSFKPDTLDPVWNEDFTFPVTRRDAVLKVQVYDKDRFGSDDFEGGVNIDLKSLEHQQRTDMWYDLAVEGDANGNGSIRLKLQYIFSRYKYYTDNFNKTEFQILRLQEDIEELNRYFELFEKPFGIILYGEIESILDKRILEKSEDISEYLISPRRSVYVSPKMLHISVAQKVENMFKGAFSNII